MSHNGAQYGRADPGRRVPIKVATIHRINKGSFGEL